MEHENEMGCDQLLLSPTRLILTLERRQVRVRPRFIDRFQRVHSGVVAPLLQNGSDLVHCPLDVGRVDVSVHLPCGVLGPQPMCSPLRPVREVCVVCPDHIPCLATVVKAILAVLECMYV